MPRGEDLPKLGFRIRAPIGTTFELHSLLGDLDLVLGQPPGASDFRNIREEKESSNGYRKRNCGVDYEEPLPAPEAICTPKRINTGHQIAGEHSTYGTTSMEDTAPPGKFILSVCY